MLDALAAAIDGISNLDLDALTDEQLTELVVGLDALNQRIEAAPAEATVA